LTLNVVRNSSKYVTKVSIQSKKFQYSYLKSSLYSKPKHFTNSKDPLLVDYLTIIEKGTFIVTDDVVETYLYT